MPLFSPRIDALALDDRGVQKYRLCIQTPPAHPRMHTAWQNTSRVSTGSATREFTLCFANVQMPAMSLAKMADYINVISQNGLVHLCH